MQRLRSALHAERAAAGCIGTGNAELVVIMRMPKTILVPTDFTACAQEAVDYALALAKRLDARVCLVHAYLIPVSGWEGGWAFPQDVVSQLEAAARAKLDATLTKARETLPTTTASFWNGDPREGVLELASDLDADLIVMGTHGRRGISRAIMGSVAEHVMRRAKCAVLAVRHPEDD